MDAQNAQGSTYGHLELKQAVGDLFFVWSDVEQAIRDQIEVLETKSGSARIQSTSRSIKHLKKLYYGVGKGRVNHLSVLDEIFQFLSDALADRNFIAHGIRGWHGNIDREAAFLRLELNEEYKELCLASLRSTIEKLSIISFQLSRLTYAATHPDQPGIENIYDDIGKKLRLLSGSQY